MTSGRVATLTDRIVEKLKIQARALDDDEFAAYLGVIRQAVYQACRRLKREGIVERFVGPNNKIVNRAGDGVAPRDRLRLRQHAPGAVPHHGRPGGGPRSAERAQVVEAAAGAGDEAVTWELDCLRAYGLVERWSGEG